LQHLMPSVKAPVLLFWGDKDTATPITDAYIMTRKMPDTIMAVAEGAGHFAMLEQPELWFSSLGSFLNIE
ncbi:MAG: alpha/beta hydrolase, partial [Alistipes sp.]|nr:alpha/beta hydrolase [Alistipes sp.]